MEFEPRAVVYFQVVGTHNTANEVFHAVHFESPAQPGTNAQPRREFNRNHRHSPPIDEHDEPGDGEGGGGDDGAANSTESDDEI